MIKVLVALLVAAMVATAAAGPAVVALFTITLGAAASASAACTTAIGTVAPATGPVRLPVVGQYTATSEYGMRVNPGSIDTGEYRLHAGLDLAESPAPGPVVAAMAGVVSAVETTRSGGLSVSIDHGGALVTRYLHLASAQVAAGQAVWAGAPLGVEGASGNVDGAHLHFSVVQNGQPTDPRPWLEGHGVTVAPPDGVGTAPPPVATDPGPTVPPVAGGAGGALLAGPSSIWPGQPVGPVGQVAAALPERVGPWVGPQVAIAAAIITAGHSRGLDAKTITIAVMTGMAESSLTNTPRGDAVRADTIGVFQEGPERGPYEVRMDPAGAAGIFYDYLLAVPGYLELEPTIAAHRAQNNDDPYHYTASWADAVTMVATLTADPDLLIALPAGGPVAGCEGGGPAPATPGASDGSGAAIVAAAQAYAGTPYSWGGGDASGPTTGIYTSPSLDGTHTVGFDCSGLVIYAVAAATGITLAHSAETQGADPRGQVVPRDLSAMRPGDVISFSEDGSGAPGSFGHVGIYLGEGQMIHAPRPGKPVQVIPLAGVAYWESMAWSIRRYSTT